MEMEWAGPGTLFSKVTYCFSTMNVTKFLLICNIRQVWFYYLKYDVIIGN